MREKLIKLVREMRRTITAWHTAEDIADRLIANGVTFATDNNVGNKWIPVTERLPDYFGVFIIAVRMPYRERLFVDSADFDPFAKTWLPSLCWGKGYEVICWMPLPKPPKEG